MGAPAALTPERRASLVFAARMSPYHSKAGAAHRVPARCGRSRLPAGCVVGRDLLALPQPRCWSAVAAPKQRLRPSLRPSGRRTPVERPLRPSRFRHLAVDEPFPGRRPGVDRPCAPPRGREAAPCRALRLALISDDAKATGLYAWGEGADLEWWTSVTIDLENEPSAVASCVFEAAPLDLRRRVVTAGQSPSRRTMGAKSAAFIPLISGDRVIAVLVAATTRRRPFPAEEIAFLEGSRRVRPRAERIRSAEQLEEALEREERMRRLGRRSALSWTSTRSCALPSDRQGIGPGPMLHPSR